MNNGSVNAKDLDRIKRLRLIDDVFMSKCFENNIECTELVVRIILDRMQRQQGIIQTLYIQAY